MGYSVTSDCCRLDGIRLVTEKWSVQLLAVEEIESSFFDDAGKFPKGSIAFDHALIMRDIGHSWQAVPDLISKAKAG